MILEPLPDYQTDARMALKLSAVPLPDLEGKRVLDVGCDMGFWCRIASERGASEVLGLDRNRVVRGEMMDLVALNRGAGIPNARFERIEIGKQYRVFGNFDVVLCLSVYHHLFEAAGGEHRPIWLWLHEHCRLPERVLLWEGPVDTSDPVVRANVSPAHHARYTREAILAEAGRYFEAEYIGPALHEPTREVWRFTPKARKELCVTGQIRPGAGGATKAFEHADGRRMDEIERILGWRPVPGSLNVVTSAPFDWEDADCYRAQVLDVLDRSKGLESAWVPRWARFYPVEIDGEEACAFRFEGDRYDERFMELIAPWRLRDMLWLEIDGRRVEKHAVKICRSH